MNTETFAEFYRRCGYATFRSASTCWYKAHPLFLMSLPRHSELSLAPGEMDGVFDANRSVLGARYFGPASGPGRASFLIVCRDKEYDLPTLGHKARNQTRHGLRHCEVRPVSWQEAAGAHDLQRETCIRQGRKPEFTTRQWSRLCEAAASLPGFEARGAFTKGGQARLQRRDWPE